jgi:putative transposase
MIQARLKGDWPCFVIYCLHQGRETRGSEGMARKLRIEYEGAIHHVINRGNYRRDLFENPGAAKAFLDVLFKAAEKFDWRVHAYVLMRNHFHLAVETPKPTLGEGMHWLQSTMATRFNRLRLESGHLFQGRYKALLIQDFTALARVVDYIHLNPVRAKILPPEQVTAYRWSSLHTFLKGPRPDILRAQDWLQARGGWADDRTGLEAYTAYLLDIARNETVWECDGLTGLACGWAIGTDAWRKQLAREYAQKSLSAGLPREERVDLRQAHWAECLNNELEVMGKKLADLPTKPRKQSWKIVLADNVRHKSGASISWLASNLQLGGSATLRSYLYQFRLLRNDKTRPVPF